MIKKSDFLLIINTSVLLDSATAYIDNMVTFQKLKEM